MKKPTIEHCEFESRIQKIREKMEKNKIDIVLIYGDEYRKENLRYVSNYWPLFERAALVVSKKIKPILLCAPEGEKVAMEMSTWEDVRLISDFLCVTVPDDIDYPLAKYTSFKEIKNEISQNEGKIERIGLVGIDDMSINLYRNIDRSFNCEIVDFSNFLIELRKVKSPSEIECLKEAAKIADAGYKKLLETNLIGLTEIQAAGIIEAECRKQNAEAVIFNVFGSGERTNTIIGRPTEKIIENGDMIMCSIAIQYQGYVATCEVPFAVGDYNEETKKVIDVLMEAIYKGEPFLKEGIPMKNFVLAVKSHFADCGLSKFDVYPPLHGIGCAEAESPYPNEKTNDVFKAGMTANCDISLFGLKGGSNRIEQGFLITKNGHEFLSPFAKEYCKKWIEDKRRRND